MYFRARYYSPQLGQFISRDPLGYVDGMSQYRAYFVPDGMDPSGKNCRAACELMWQIEFSACGFTSPWDLNPGRIACELAVAIKAELCHEACFACGF